MNTRSIAVAIAICWALGSCFVSSVVAQESSAGSGAEGQPGDGPSAQAEGPGSEMPFVWPTEEAVAAMIWEAAKGDDGKEIVMVNHSVRLREHPPSGWFKIPGEESDIVSETETVVVIGSERVSTLFSTQNWYQVRRLCRDGVDCTASEGWIYGGKASDNLLVPVSDKELTRYVAGRADATDYFTMELGVPVRPGALAVEIEETVEEADPRG